MPKKPTSPVHTQEQLTPAQSEAKKYNEVASHRVLSHSPRRSASDHTPLLSFNVSSPSYDDLEILAEDEAEAIRAFRQCYGIQGSSITCRVHLLGDDPRPQPQSLAAGAA